ncbi:MAG: TraB/GumN family protein [Bacteroidota bacterium]
MKRKYFLLPPTLPTLLILLVGMKLTNKIQSNSVKGKKLTKIHQKNKEQVTISPKKKRKMKQKKKIWNPLKWILLLLSYPMAKQLYLHPIKTAHGTHLYRIEKEEEHTAYLYGVSHIKSDRFTLPDQVQEAATTTSALVTELSFDEDQDLIDYRNTLFQELLKRAAHEEIGILQPFFDHVKSYQKKGELHFLYNGNIWLTIKRKGKVQYTEKLLYELCKAQQHMALETLKEELTAVDIHYHDPKKIGRLEAKLLWEALVRYRDDPNYQAKMNASTDLYDDQPSENQLSKIPPSLVENYAITQRNQAWIIKISNWMKQQSLFLAVGVLHLPWENGLLSSLLQKGYTITRIEKDGTESTVNCDNYNTPFL